MSEWDAGQVGMYDPATNAWKEWKLPGNNPMAYAVFVDDADVVWVTDWGANGFARFDPVTETFAVRTHPSPNANVREILGRHAEIRATGAQVVESSLDPLASSLTDSLGLRASVRMATD